MVSSLPWHGTIGMTALRSCNSPSLKQSQHCDVPPSIEPTQLKALIGASIVTAHCLIASPISPAHFLQSIPVPDPECVPPFPPNPGRVAGPDPECFHQVPVPFPKPE